MEADDLGYLEIGEEGATADLLLRWSGTIQPIPLPAHLTPRSGAPLVNVPGDALMKVSPQIIAHMQRTAAQGGLQVVSPRQVPFCKTMIRTHGGKRLLGDHVVGSVADKDCVWPTIDGDDMHELLPDEPLPTPYIDHTIQRKTKTVPLTKSGKMLTDPILSCLIRGRAVVDLLRRDDIAGDADGVLELLAAAWGVPLDVLGELDAYTLGIEGSLLRHAIKSDEVYPIMYAPIHIRKVIATGASEVTRQLLPEDTAMDWKRARVFCEAVFSLAMTIEGHRLTDVRAFPPPGDPAAKSDRRGVLVFQPAPASAWTFSPRTFSIYPLKGTMKRKTRGIPREVMAALTKYVNLVRPISHAMVEGHRAVARKTSAFPVPELSTEAISEGYVTLVRSIMTGGARGRTAAAAVRSVIYSAMENSPMDIRLRLSRYFKLVKEEVRIHLGLDVVPDTMIVRLASRFVQLGEKVRSSVLAEAARRGSTADEWWEDIMSQAPQRYEMLREGSHGWARVALWLMLKGPTDRWDKLLTAVKLSAVRDAAVGSVGAIALPAKKGSIERLVAAGQHTVKEVSKVYGASYAGVYDVGLAIADELEALGRARSADILREASYLWMLRARAYRGANVHAVAHGEETRSDLHLRVYAEPVDLVIAPAPYRAYQAYVTHAECSPLVPTEVKRLLRAQTQPPLSEVFLKINRPFVAAPVSTVTKYLLDPPQLATDVERSWRELVTDLRKTATMYGAEVETRAKKNVVSKAFHYFEPMVIEMPTVSTIDYYATLAQLDTDIVDGIEDYVDNLDPVYSEMITERTYASPTELLAYIREMEKVTAPAAEGSVEVTR